MDNFKNRIKIETDTLKEPLCKGKWRDEVKKQLSKFKGQYKILSIICILYILSVYGCASQEEQPKMSGFYGEADAQGIYTEHEKTCNGMGEKIKIECMALTDECSLLKQEWDIEGC